jgi:SAM-dependent methyltransferase
MELTDLLNRTLPPDPWSEGDNIPWDDAAFSHRMLREHLSQEHDRASRRFSLVDQHVRFIHQQLLSQRISRVLDLTCGPGLYTSRLAKLGHDCVGIDFPPAAIECAVSQTKQEQYNCVYRLEDVRGSILGEGFDLILMVNGQLNVFRREEARCILQRGYAALNTAGMIVLEPQRYDWVKKLGLAENSWSSHPKAGLFSDQPHLCLQESFWHAEEQANTQRFYIVDAKTMQVTRHAMTSEAYDEEELCTLLEDLGFAEIEVFPSLIGETHNDGQLDANFVLVGRKRK